MVRFVGLDIGKWKRRAAIMNREGNVVDEFWFTNNHEGIESLAAKLTVQDSVVMESTGSVWTNPYDQLDPEGFEPSISVDKSLEIVYWIGSHDLTSEGSSYLIAL